MFGRASALGLPAVVIVFAVLVHGGWSAEGFGHYHDDSLYWVSAKALAQGQGYRIESLPGEPAQTKYPALYPWLLSFVWRLWPSFPENLYGGFLLTLSLGCGFLVGCYVVARQLGASEIEGLAMTGVLALHPTVLQLNLWLLSDIPFAALSAAALAAAYRALSSSEGGESADNGAVWWTAASVLAAAAVMTRSLGVTVIAGIAAAAAARRRFRAALGFAALPAAVFVGGVAWSAAQRGSLGAELPAGYQQTWLFYTDYLGFWRHCVADWATFLEMVEFNFLQLLKQPAVFAFHMPVVGFQGGMLQAVAVTLSLGMAKGAVESLRRRGAHPMHWAFAFTVPAVLAWNYALVDRFLLPFAPLMLFGAWREARSMARLSWGVVRGSKPLLERGVAVVLLGLLSWLAVHAAYRHVPRALAAASDQRRSLAEHKQEAYEWIRRHSLPGDVFIAYEDAELYLHTGRRAIRPLIFNTAAFYLQSQEIRDADLANIMATANAVGARYWVRTGGDFHLEAGEEAILSRLDRLLGQRPPVFESDGGRVRVYDLARDREGGLGGDPAGLSRLQDSLPAPLPGRGDGSLPPLGRFHAPLGANED